MKHDESCELDWPVARWYGAGCRCLRRAIERDPLPGDLKPIYARGRVS